MSIYIYLKWFSFSYMSEIMLSYTFGYLMDLFASFICRVYLHPMQADEGLHGLNLKTTGLCIPIESPKSKEKTLQD